MTYLNSAFTVTILGSGTCVPSLERSSCSVMVQGGGQTLLLDAGPGTMRQLLKAGTDIFAVDTLLLSHFHPDHSLEFPGLLFSTKYPDIHRRTKPLTVIGGTGLVTFYQRLNMAFDSNLTMPDSLMTLVELDGAHDPAIEGTYFTIESARVNHRDESRAFRITSPDGTAMVYSGDTDVSEDLVMLATDADVLVCESSVPDQHKVKGHLTPSLAGEMAAAAGVKLLVLTHFYPECGSAGAEVEAQCRRTWDGPLVLARDLMTID